MSEGFMRLEAIPLLRRLRDWMPQPAQPPFAIPIPVAEVVEPAPQLERRTEQRHACHREAMLRPVTLIQSAPWHSIVLDISSGGISLAIERAVHVGAFFVIELPDPMLEKPVKVVRGRVIHAAAQGHSYWLLGIVFETELTAEELETLL
jgi:hypothetical protein